MYDLDRAEYQLSRDGPIVRLLHKLTELWQCQTLSDKK